MTIHETSRRSLWVVLPLVAAIAAGCAGAVEPEDSEGIMQSRQAVSVADPVPCSAWDDTVVANTSKVILGAGTLVDSYQSSLGAYGGYNVGSAAVVQAGTTILNNGGVVRGTLQPYAPAGFSVVPVPSGAKNLPLGSSVPGSLNIGTVAQSITLAPGDYVAANVNVSAPGAINITAAGQVRIWVTQSLNLGGYLNRKGIPKNLAFLVPNAGWVNINGGGALYGMVYAPTSGVVVNGPVFGTVIGKSVTLNSGAAVHFDQSSACSSPEEPQIDQSFVGPSDLSAGLYGPPVLVAQSYTAGITGTLQGVAVDVTGRSSYVARIQVKAVADGVPAGPVLGQARASKSGDLSVDTVIPFSSPIPQVAGQQYAILVDYPEAPAFYDGIPEAADWNGATGNAYPAGTLLYSWDDGATWESYESEGADVHFQTFVVAD